MTRTWKRSLLVGLTAVFAILIVTDVQAGIIFRRRRTWRDGYVYNTVPTAGGMSAAAAPGVAVNTPDVNVNASPQGVTVNAPGANVDTRVYRTGLRGRIRSGANVNASGANVRSGANVSPPGAAPEDANLRVRGQSPDDPNSDAGATAPPAAPPPLAAPRNSQP